MPVSGTVPHTNTSVTFKLLSLFDSSTEVFSLGIRDVHLLFINSTTTPTLDACLFVSLSDSDPSCTCGAGKYNTAKSGSCSTCDSTCLNCMGSKTTDCTACATGYSFNGKTCMKCDSTCAECSGTTQYECVRCASSSSFLYYNGTCQVKCTAPLVSQIIGNVNLLQLTMLKQ